jgi:hypothetical protein
MMMVRQLTHTPAPPPICREIARRAARRVAFKNDHPDLMKPRATDKFIFEKNGIITNYVHEKQEPVVTRPRSRTLRFGRGRSLAEMAGEAPQESKRSICITTERVNPEEIIMKKIPASPVYNPETAISNSRKIWQKMEVDAINRSYMLYYDLIFERSRLVDRCNSSKKFDEESTRKIREITTWMQKLKNEMKERQHNLRTLRAFAAGLKPWSEREEEEEEMQYHYWYDPRM